MNESCQSNFLCVIIKAGEKMHRVAIVDDEPFFSDTVKTITENYFKGKDIDFDIRIYNCPKELTWDLEEGQYFDIYLFDIEMEEVSGMELANIVRQLYDEPYIIFITAHLEYSIRGYEYNTWRYIPKDMLQEGLPKALEAIGIKMHTKVKKFYVIEMYTKLSRIAYEDIFYIHKAGKYTCFITRQGILRERKSLVKVYDDLQDNQFVITDRSYVINLKHVMHVDDYSVYMRNGDVIPVSAAQYQKVKTAVSSYWR